MKIYKVRIEFDMIAEFTEQAENEEAANKAAIDHLKEKLYAPGHDGKMFCELDDPDVYVANYAIVPIEAEQEGEDQ